MQKRVTLEAGWMGLLVSLDTLITGKFHFIRDCHIRNYLVAFYLNLRFIAGLPTSVLQFVLLLLLY